MLSLILLAFSFVFGVLATLGVPSHPRFNLGWAALTFLVAALLFGGIAGINRL
jgi:hypothetical protein